MDYFSEIPEGQAITFSGGVYRQVKIAERGGKVYASYGGGWVRLLASSITSHPRVRWYDVEAEGYVFRETVNGVAYDN